MRALAALPLAALGAWTAVCAIAVNAHWGWLLVAVVGTLLATYALPAGWLRLGFVVGWLSAIAVAVLGRPEGDWVIAGDWHGYALLLTSLVMLIYAVGTIPRRTGSAGEASSPT